MINAEIEKEISKLTYLLVALIFGGSILLLAPLGVYVEHVEEFSVSGRDLVAVLSLCAFVAASLMFVCFLVLGRVSKVLSASVVGLLFGISLSVVIQSQFLLWKFGPLDGRKINWEAWNSIGWLELVLWVAAPGLSIFFALRHKTKFEMAVTGLFFFLLVSIGGKLLQVDFADDGGKVSLREVFSVDTNSNTLLIVLDTVQSDVFGEILEKFPRDLVYLKGFTYYPNTLGGYPTTRVSVPLIVSGKNYKNEMPVAHWISEEVKGQTIVDHFKNAGRQISVVLNGVPGDSIQNAIIPMSTIGYSGWQNLRIQVSSVLDAGFFSLAPTFTKPLIYDDGNWFLSKAIKENDDRTPYGPHGDDARLVQEFVSHFNLQPSLEGSFKYFHLRGAHFPLQVDEKFQRAERAGSAREDYLRQTRGVFSNLRPMMQVLIDSGIYDDMEILIVADHGTLSVPAADMWGSEPGLESDMLSSARPVFIHKRKGESASALRVSDAARQLADIPCILSGYSDSFGCEKERDWSGEGNRPRTFYYYRWKDKYWQLNYMPPMQSYSISGDVRDPKSWSKGAEFPGPTE